MYKIHLLYKEKLENVEAFLCNTMLRLMRPQFFLNKNSLQLNGLQKNVIM